MLYFNNPGNRPAGLTVQVLDPRSLGISRNASRTPVAVTAQVIWAQAGAEVYLLTRQFQPERTTEATGGPEHV